MRAVLAVAALLFTSWAHAVTWSATTDFAWSVGTGNITAFPGPGSGNMWSSGTKAPLATGPQWTGPAKQLPFKPSAKANFRASFSPSAMAKAITSPTAMIPLLASPLISYLLNQACVRIAGGTMQIAPGGQWEECHFGSQPVTEYAYTAGTGGPWFGSPQQAFQAWVGTNPFGPGCGGAAFGFWDGGYVHFSATCSGTTYPDEKLMLTVRTVNQQVQDGWQPSDSVAAEAKVKTQLDDWTQCDFSYGYGACAAEGGRSSAGVLDEVMASGGQVEGTLAPPVVETPIVEAPVQTTYSDPATGKTVSSTDQTTNDYSCLVIDAGKAVQCSQFKTKTTTTATTSTPQGGTATTTTTTNVVTQQGSPEADSKCQAGTVGCMDVGAPPDALPLAERSVAVSMVADAGWDLAPAVCPAPKTVVLGGQSYSFSLSALCDFATGVRPMIVAVAYLTATLLFFGIARKEG